MWPHIIVAIAGNDGNAESVNWVGMFKDGVEVVADEAVRVVNVGW